MIKRILIADPDKRSGTVYGEYLRKGGYQPVVVDEADRVLEVGKLEVPNLLLLESQFQRPTGFDICRRWQADLDLSSIPLILISEQADEIDRILGLELGAEDFLKKPCHPRELLLKVGKILARFGSTQPQKQLLEVGDLVLDRDVFEARLRGERLELTSLEFRLLNLLVERVGRVQTREKLLRDVWGYNAEINSRTLDTHVRNLRSKLGDHGTLIETAYGFGYRFVEPRTNAIATART